MDIKKMIKDILNKLHRQAPRTEAQWNALAKQYNRVLLPSNEGFWTNIADEYQAWREVFGGGFNVQPEDPSMYDRATSALPSLAYYKNDDGSITMNLEGGASDIKW